MYHDLLTRVQNTNEKGEVCYFEFIHGGNSQTYVHHKGNPTQIYWLWRKSVRNSVPSISNIQQLLDESVYNDGSMSVYEHVVGDGFTTPGGLAATKVVSMWGGCVPVDLCS